MAYIQGSLTKALNDNINKYGKTIRLSIDEDSRTLNKVSRQTSSDLDKIALRDRLWMDQLRVIATCHQLDIPLVEISFAPGYNWSNVDVVNDRVVKTYSYTKSEANAFNAKGVDSSNVTLEAFLKQEDYKTLVVMGYHANACVVATVGADKLFPESFLTNEYRGALQHGFTVLTCEQILSGGDDKVSEATSTKWDYGRKGLEFYSDV